MNKEKTANLTQIRINLYAEKNIEEFGEEKVKLLLDSSIFGTFGLLDAYKIKYFLKKEVVLDGNSLIMQYSQFTIKTYEKYIILM